MPNVNFNPARMQEFDIANTKPEGTEQKPEQESPELQEILRQEREYNRQLLAQQAAHSNQKISELYEQNQTTNRALLEMMKKLNPEPDYNSNDDYFRDSYTTKEANSLTPEEIKRLAAEAAEETFRNTVQRGTQAQQERSSREKVLADWFTENCTDLHPYQNQVIKKYRQAQVNFPNASVDEQFSWAIETVRDVVSDLNPPAPPKPSPVGKHGTSRNVYANQDDGNAREMARSEQEVLSDYYHEISEIEAELDRAFDM